GAFMKTRAEAAQLAEAMKAVGQRMNVDVSYLLSPMDEPLGRNVGNALEVIEAIETLRDRGPKDLVELTLDLCEKVATASRAQLQGWLEDGSAWKKFVAMVEAQDGNAAALEKLNTIHAAPIVEPLPTRAAGVVRQMNAEIIGRAAVLLGAGRTRADDAIDFAVGFSQIKKIGEPIQPNEPLLFIHARDEQALVEVRPLLEKAIVIE
ncbi:MAG: hypothetical protein ACXWBS_10860, partial [Chthoniobacterales bacterium]